MKKMFLPIVITLLILSATAFAGDLPESVMMENNVDVIIGTITYIDKNVATIQVSKSFFEIATDTTIQVEDFEYLIGSGPLGTAELITPSAGDFCAVAIIPQDENLFVYGSLCAKSDSLDTKTLKLEGGNEFIGRMNEYINTDHYSKEARDAFFANKTSEDTATDSPTDVAPQGNYILYLLVGIIDVAAMLILLFVLKFRKAF